MNVRKTMICSAAMAALVFFALPASAMPTYMHGSNDAERAQTEALNADAAARAHGTNAMNNSNDMHDNRGGTDHDRGMNNYDSHMQGHGGGANNIISVDFGTIAIGYSDGYWDNGHRWHAWRNASDARNYRMHHGSSFHTWRHDRDSDMGWHNRR